MDNLTNKPIVFNSDELLFTDEELNEYAGIFDEALESINQSNLENVFVGLDEIHWNLLISLSDYDNVYTAKTTVSQYLIDTTNLSVKIYNYLINNRRFTNGLGLYNSTVEDETWRSSRYVDCVGIAAGVVAGQLASSTILSVRNHPVAAAMDDFIDYMPTLSFMNTMMFYRSMDDFEKFKGVDLMKNYIIAVQAIAKNYAAASGLNKKDK